MSIPVLTSEALQTAAPPAVFARAAAIASQADEAVEVVDAALDHSSHRDRTGGRRITVSTSAKDLVQELQKTVDELAGAPDRASRSNGGQHHAVVTPRVEASPDRSDFAKLGETIALEQTKQFADDIRSQVAGRELAEMNERLMAFDDSLQRLGSSPSILMASSEARDEPPPSTDAVGSRERMRRSLGWRAVVGTPAGAEVAFSSASRPLRLEAPQPPPLLPPASQPAPRPCPQPRPAWFRATPGSRRAWPQHIRRPRRSPRLPGCRRGRHAPRPRRGLRRYMTRRA